MKNIFKISIVLIFYFFLGGCQNNTSQHKNDNGVVDTNAESAINEESSLDLISLQLEQLDIMDIQLGQSKQLNLGATLKVNGQLELPPQNIASVSAILGGRVQSIAVIEGDYVKKGQVIAELSNPEFVTLQREYLSALNNFSLMSKDYQRKKELLKDSIVSIKIFQEAEAGYNKERFEVNSMKTILKVIGINTSQLEKGDLMSSIPVISPINGYIQNIEINIGKVVPPEKEMFEIVDNEQIHLGLKVFEKDIDKVKIQQNISFSLTTRPDVIYEAEIFALGKAFEMDTRAVKVHAKIIGYHEGLLPGMFVDARIVTKDKKVIALPDEAFITDKGLDYIFIQTEIDKDDVTLKRIQVNKGISDLGYSEVYFLDDVQDNVIVVIKGAFYVNSELNKGEFEEHDH